MLHNVLFCIEWHTYISILFKYTKMSKEALFIEAYQVTCMCTYPLKEHMYVTTSIEQHIHAFILLQNISMLETQLGFQYSSQAVCVLMYVC